MSNLSSNANNKTTSNDPSGINHYAIEPAEDDGIDDTLTNKHVSSSRFLRNHRLLADIFNDYVIPDSRSVVTQQRIEQLKKQVTTLELHQEKLNQELQSIEEKYENKKKKMLSSSEDFQNEMNKV